MRYLISWLDFCNTNYVKFCLFWNLFYKLKMRFELHFKFLYLPEMSHPSVKQTAQKYSHFVHATHSYNLKKGLLVIIFMRILFDNWWDWNFFSQLDHWPYLKFFCFILFFFCPFNSFISFNSWLYTLLIQKVKQNIFQIINCCEIKKRRTDWLETAENGKENRVGGKKRQRNGNN